MDCSLPGPSVHGILQARILEWVVMPSSRWSSLLRDQTHISCGSWIAGGFFTAEPAGKHVKQKPRMLQKSHIFMESGNLFRRQERMVPLYPIQVSPHLEQCAFLGINLKKKEWEEEWGKWGLASRASETMVRIPAPLLTRNVALSNFLGLCRSSSHL